MYLELSNEMLLLRQLGLLAQHARALTRLYSCASLCLRYSKGKTLSCRHPRRDQLRTDLHLALATKGAIGRQPLTAQSQNKTGIRMGAILSCYHRKMRINYMVICIAPVAAHVIKESTLSSASDVPTLTALNLRYAPHALCSPGTHYANTLTSGTFPYLISTTSSKTWNTPSSSARMPLACPSKPTACTTRVQ